MAWEAREDDKQNLVGRRRWDAAAVPQPLMRPICLIRVVHPPNPPPPLLRVIYPRTVTVGEVGGTRSPHKTEIKKKCNTSTFSSAPFIIIQKLVFNAMSSSNHVRVRTIQILS